MRNKFFVLISIISFWIAGCGTIQALNRPIPEPEIRSIIEDGYSVYRGIIHIHSIYSDDATGTYEEIAKVANKLELDFLIMTEDYLLEALKNEREGFYDKTLILIGEEAKLETGHLLVLNVKDKIRGKTVQETIDLINAQGGISFIAHPFDKKDPWRDWDITDYQGMEIYNLACDILDDEDRFSLFLKVIFFSPDQLFRSIVDRPDKALNRWDQLLLEKRIVGIAGCDVHQGVRILGRQLDPYIQMFKVVTNNILLPEGEKLSKNTLYNALRKGNCYFSFDIIKEARGFIFAILKDEEVKAVMGDEIEYQQGLNFYIFVPDEKSWIRLFRNGELIEEIEGEILEYRIFEKGIYRVEVYLKNRPWIFSNPIYVR